MTEDHGNEYRRLLFFESDPPLTCRHFILYRTAYAIVRQLVA